MMLRDVRIGSSGTGGGDARTESIGAVFVGLLGGVLLFETYRRLGWVWWPLGRAERLWEYGLLLYSHVVLVLTVGVCLLWSTCRDGRVGRLSWGTSRGWPFLSGVGIVVWLWAAWVVTGTRPRIEGPLVLVVVMAVAKASLTGFGEEACFRGLLQGAAVARLGAAAGIGFQACIYAGFHIGLRSAIVTQSLFIPAVFLLGVVFGIIAHLTRGIAWVSVFHSGIDMVIEWSNIS